MNECAVCTEDTGFHINGECKRPRTILEADQWLALARLDFFTAAAAADLPAARRHYRRLDFLLECRHTLSLVPA